MEEAAVAALSIVAGKGDKRAVDALISKLQGCRNMCHDRRNVLAMLCSVAERGDRHAITAVLAELAYLDTLPRVSKEKYWGPCPVWKFWQF